MNHIKTALFVTFVAMCTLFGIPKSSFAQELVYTEAQIGKYFPVSVTVNPKPYPNQLITVSMILDTATLQKHKYLKVAITSQNAAKVTSDTISGESGAFSTTGIDLRKDISLSLQNGKAADFKEYFKPLTRSANGCIITKDNQKFQGDCFDFEIVKTEESSISMSIDIHNVKVDRPAGRVPIFIELRDKLPEEFYTLQEGFVTYATTYPELLNRVAIKTVKPGRYLISWDPISISTNGFEWYEVSIYRKSDERSPCLAENPFIYGEMSRSFLEENLPENENYLLQIRTKQNGAINDKIDCGTYYYLNTNDIAGAKVPLIPVASYRTDYIEVEPYFPPSKSVVAEGVTEEKIRDVEKQLAELRDIQIDAAKETKNIQKTINKQEKNIGEVKSMVQKIMEFLKKIFGF